MKPIIGICANYATDDKIGIITELGFPKQEWQLLANDYIKAIELAGGSPLIIPVVEDFENTERILPILDGILFSGGSDIDPSYYGELPQYGLRTVTPFRDSHEIALAKKILFETSIPVLGICRGIQLLNVAAGGTLYQDLQRYRSEGFNHTLINVPKDYPMHEAAIKPDSKLHKIFKKDKIKINSFNHQAIKTIGGDFEATMIAPDGLIEGIESPGNRFVVAVQWHPETMIERYPEYLVLFKEFVRSCSVS